VVSNVNIKAHAKVRIRSIPWQNDFPNPIGAIEMKSKLAALAFLAPLGLCSVAFGQGMAVSQQNALVQKYCAVCHTDAHPNGGLSLQHFDAAHVEPSLAAMMVSKLKSGAMGAAGIQRPDQATQDGLFKALNEKSDGAQEWTLTRTPDALTVSILGDAPATEELYRLKLTCRPDTRQAEMQLTWSPKNAGDFARELSVVADGGAAVVYKVEGHEKMGNASKNTDGTDVTTGPAAALLHTTPLPVRTLTVGDLFTNAKVLFPFDRLTPAMRKELTTCFTQSSASR
jgi:hypothetical protein